MLILFSNVVFTEICISPFPFEQLRVIQYWYSGQFAQK